MATVPCEEEWKKVLAVDAVGERSTIPVLVDVSKGSPE